MARVEALGMSRAVALPRLFALALLAAGPLVAPAGAAPDACAADAATCAAARAAAADGGRLSLLQMRAASGAPSRGPLGPPDDVVFAHIPFNFGHTIEKVALFGTGMWAMAEWRAVMMAEDAIGNPAAQWAVLGQTRQPSSQVWGHMYPELHETSSVTGCPMYFTPGKHWPQALADKYIKGRPVFGMLRDPYERLVAFFRGNMSGYGGSYPEFLSTCDVNSAVKQMMRDYMAGDRYAHGCTFVPQAEYFDTPNGITLAVDNRKFPASVNELFAAHNSSLRINTDDILHVSLCPDAWAGDLDCEARALVKQVYARDFELLCTNFGYCDDEESCCIEGVPSMCPADLAAKKQTATRCSA